MVSLDELSARLDAGSKLKGYIGYEPSGLPHVGWLVWIFKVKDLVNAGIDFTVLEATWHAYINDKLGGNLDLIRTAARITRIVIEASGVPSGVVRYVDAEDLASDKEYWSLVLRVAKNASLARIRRALTIMGRKAEEVELDSSKIIYPLMQVSDIFYLDLDIALGGMDQRKAHMLARDIAEKLDFKKPVALHTPIISSLQGPGRMDVKGDIDEILADVKMSKSKPDTAIFVTDSDEDIRRKIRKAYCPARQVEGNPILEITKYILFAQDGFVLKVDRPTKYGGPVEYTSYGDVENDFSRGNLHPLDLKNAVAESLINLLRPIRTAVLSDSQAREAIRLIEGSVSR